MRLRPALLLPPFLSTILLVALPSLGETQQPPTPQAFQVEWQPRSGHMRPGIEGFVYNPSGYRVGSIRLKVEVLDKEGRVLREQFAWVYGAIDAGGRGYFALQPLRPGETCRIAVESFDLLSRQAP
ncbi:MAG: FxLYD domain-containing protein [Candidatus Rokuibacteriota bacterium]